MKIKMVLFKNIKPETVEHKVTTRCPVGPENIEHAIFKTTSLTQVYDISRIGSTTIYQPGTAAPLCSFCSFHEFRGSWYVPCCKQHALTQG